MLLPCDEGMIETLRARITQSALHHGKGMGFLPAFGLFRIDDRSLPVGIMYDRALLALASVKGNYAQRPGARAHFRERVAPRPVCARCFGHVRGIDRKV